ncbi:Transcriptional regulator, TetR family [plant metagenome]|uniref:Transcriptional regulator, TetR family n=1 Tax=plant metagenome TaxID=1297885 RepID=A0A484RZC1_9ZZZZ
MLPPMRADIHRPKQPHLVRARLLAAGAALLAQGDAVSIGKVAALADVTKGAVQHHFPTRDALVQAIYDDLLAKFERQLADCTTARSPAGRYVEATLALATDPAPAELWRALLAASAAEHRVAQRWSAWVASDRAREGTNTNKLIARLAADGLWLSETLGTYSLSDTERASLARALRTLADDEEEANR